MKKLRGKFSLKPDYFPFSISKEGGGEKEEQKERGKEEAKTATEVERERVRGGYK